MSQCDSILSALMEGQKRISSHYSRVISDSQKETLRKLHTIHGHAATRNHGHSRTYQSWMSIKERCDSPTHKSYNSYGGRGIRYCERWILFVNFLDDMGERPTGKTLGRIENDGDYKPSNCEWQTHKEQARNRRNSKNIEFDGKRLCLSAWAEFLGCSDDVLQKRLAAGWSIESALTVPIRSMLPRGQTKRGNQYSKYHG